VDTWTECPLSVGMSVAHLARRFQRPSRLRPRARTNARRWVDALWSGKGCWDLFSAIEVGRAL
jgi:hypothetical protein